MTYPDLIQLIISTRKKQGLKQTDMAEMLNMNLLAYQRLEQGKTQLPVFRMLQIFELLGIEIKLRKLPPIKYASNFTGKPPLTNGLTI